MQNARQRFAAQSSITAESQTREQRENGDAEGQVEAFMVIPQIAAGHFFGERAQDFFAQAAQPFAILAKAIVIAGAGIGDAAKIWLVELGHDFTRVVAGTIGAIAPGSNRRAAGCADADGVNGHLLLAMQTAREG